jgi:hypothetical protein
MMPSRSWPSLLQPVGFSAVPATIPAGTLLYHLRPRTANAPAFHGRDWLAFDPQHSYVVRSMLDSPKYGADLHTFAVEQPLNVHYFDGPSAAKGPNATALQNIIAFGRPDVNFTWDELPTPELWMPEDPSGLFLTDVKRVDRLCQLANGWNSDGYVRNAMCFELVLCYTGTSKLHRTSSVSVSPHGVDAGTSFWDPAPTSASWEHYRAANAHAIRP